jgi:carbon monoxide dehydrogenase subunit G
MELVNEFVVNKPVEQAWPILTDVERIAPCMPGAQLTEIEGDVYRGLVKVKVGPIQAQFKGQATFLELEDEQHRAVLKADGRDTGGKGNASARITARLEAVDATSSRCSVHTDLDINGKVAQFGRGVLPEISKKLIDQFASNLNTMIDNDGGPAAAATDTASSASGGSATPGAPQASDATATDPTATDPTAETVVDPDGTTDEAASGWEAPSGDAAPGGAPSVRRVDSAPAEPIDLVGTAGPTMAKRLIPLIGIAITTFFLLRRRRRRHHRD